MEFNLIKKLLVIVSIILPWSCFAQTFQDSLKDSLRSVTDVPYIGEYENRMGIGCGDYTFWNIVDQKLIIVPYLINELTNTTEVNIVVPNFGGKYTVADITYQIIQEIVKGIPTFELLGIEFGKDSCGYCTYWNHLRESIQNRISFQAALKSWFQKNKDNLVWVISNESLTGDNWGTRPVNGHFEIKE